MRIQIVEDDCALNDGIVLALKESGLSFYQCGSIRQAKEGYEQQMPELIILDVNLPDGSGYDYLRWIREKSEVPVLMLTANDLEMDEVMGLNLGADDYMTKPFSLAVLRARVQALGRRNLHRDHTEWHEDGFWFDFEALVFRKNGQELSLSMNEQKLLRMFIANPGKILTRELLMEKIWNNGSDFVDENALSVTVNRLRSKLEDRKERVTYIQTVYGQGYLWQKRMI